MTKTKSRFLICYSLDEFAHALDQVPARAHFLICYSRDTCTYRDQTLFRRERIS